MKTTAAPNLATITPRLIATVDHLLVWGYRQSHPGACDDRMVALRQSLPTCGYRRGPTLPQADMLRNGREDRHRRISLKVNHPLAGGPELLGP